MDQNNTRPIKKILYATDLTESSPEAYQYVLNLAKQFNAEIVSLHVVDKYSESSAMRFAMCYLTREEKQEIVSRERSRSLDEMAYRNRQSFIRQQLRREDALYPDQLGLTIENRVVFGNIEEQILKQADASNCDLIVMGAHEKPFFSFTATLSKRVTKRSKVPVTVVPAAHDRKAQAAGFLPSLVPPVSAAR